MESLPDGQHHIEGGRRIYETEQMFIATSQLEKQRKRERIFLKTKV